MKKEYLTFTPDIKGLVENQEVKLTIKDLTPGTSKYDASIVKAIVSSDPGQLPEGDVLHVRSWTGVLYPQTWAIKILEELEETEAGLPHGETINAAKK
ncbi:phenylphosphate carboxylase subunit gamma [Chloroflexota bacterium]